MKEYHVKDRMMKSKIWLAFVLLWVFCLTQCTPTILTGEITTTGVSVTKTEIHFSGTSTLPTGHASKRSSTRTTKPLDGGLQPAPTCMMVYGRCVSFWIYHCGL